MKNLQISRSSKKNAGDCSYVQLFQSPTRKHNSIFLKLVSNAIIHVLEASLTALLSPVMIWQWLFKHNHFMIIFRIIVEVTLELVMLIVFAGVSILTTIAFILDDFYNTDYYIKKDSNSYRKEKK